MPTLTIEIDLPEEAYQAVVALPVEERRRVVTNAFAVATNGAPQTGESVTMPAGIVTPTQTAPELIARLREKAKAQAASYQDLQREWAEQPETGNEPSFEEHMANINANREALGERRVYRAMAE
jgi:hypothetical protein